MRLRRIFVVTLLSLAVPVGAASLAYGCTALATMTVQSGVAPGQTITGTGKAFNGGGHGTPAGATPVELRWNTRTGPLMATAAPADASGNISFSFVAPNVPPGSYVLIGVQTNPANGTPFYGTPARQSVTIVAGARETAGRGGAVAADEQPATAAAATSAASASAAPAVAARQPSSPKVVGSPSGSSVGAAAPAPAGATVQPSAPAAAASSTAVDAAQAAAATTGGSASVEPPSVATSPDVVTTVTRALAATSSDGGSSPVAALLLMGLGLGLVLVVSGRWLTTRLPGSD